MLLETRKCWWLSIIDVKDERSGERCLTKQGGRGRCAFEVTIPVAGNALKVWAITSELV